MTAGVTNICPGSSQQEISGLHASCVYCYALIVQLITCSKELYNSEEQQERYSVEYLKDELHLSFDFNDH